VLGRAAPSINSTMSEEKDVKMLRISIALLEFTKLISFDMGTGFRK